MKVDIRNSHFEKKEERYIFDMFTDNPYLEPVYYYLITPQGAMSMSEGHFTFDGQVFSREKKHGGNRPSSYNIRGVECKKK